MGSNLLGFEDLPFDVLTQIVQKFDIYSLEAFSRLNRDSRGAAKEQIIEVEKSLLIIKKSQSFCNKLKIDQILREDILINNQLELTLRGKNLISRTNNGRIETLILELDSRIDININLLNIYKCTVFGCGFEFYIIYKNKYIYIQFDTENRIICYEKHNLDSDIKCIYLPRPSTIQTEKTFYRFDETEDETMIANSLLEPNFEYKNFKLYVDKRNTYLVYNGKYRSFFIIIYLLRFSDNFTRFLISIYNSLCELFKEIDWKKELTDYESGQQIPDKNVFCQILDQIIEILKKHFDILRVTKYRIK
jgi:hypothetical protein